jgi:hypothetical protein
MTIEERLQKAIEHGETLKIIYLGGSQPGAKRDIAPISLKNGKVRARCYSSNAVKTFIASKIVIEDEESDSHAKSWSPDAKPHIRFNTIEEFLMSEKKRLSDFGWHINCGENSLSLHRRFKNGNPLKGSDISLDYEEYAYDSVFGEDGEIHKENIRKSARPWCVRGKDKTTRTYTKLDSAADTFLEWASELAPANNK